MFEKNISINPNWTSETTLKGFSFTKNMYQGKHLVDENTFSCFWEPSQALHFMCLPPACIQGNLNKCTKKKIQKQSMFDCTLCKSQF